MFKSYAEHKIVVQLSLYELKYRCRKSYSYIYLQKYITYRLILIILEWIARKEEKGEMRFLLKGKKSNKNMIKSSSYT